MATVMKKVINLTLKYLSLHFTSYLFLMKRIDATNLVSFTKMNVGMIVYSLDPPRKVSSNFAKQAITMICIKERTATFTSIILMILAPVSIEQQQQQV
jgi:hypothetical protein